MSIDQYIERQRNGSPVGRVAQDAERGAEAILKTIGEFAHQESSQEAVARISNLGSRIDAITVLT